ncbi:MAG: carbamate kinase [Spirochaetales bacterium]|nr:carbamate kinase [Spirochaetales bacterium]
MNKKIVIAIGGNSIIRPGEKGTIEQQWAAADETCRYIAGIIKSGWKVLVTHGNGPQIGNILLRSEIASSTLPTLPLDVCGADSQGAMGYMLQQLLDRELKKAGLSNKCPVTVVTQVVADQNDPAFSKPTKPIGPFYSREEAARHRIEDHWDITEDASRGYRRVVPSPLPVKIVEQAAIRALLHKGFVCICTGGGGLPVRQLEDGSYRGLAAVIDKDRASALLASAVGAHTLLISTAVEQVFLHYRTDRQTGVARMTVAEAETWAAEGHFAGGSMLPKIEAACMFLKNGGRQVIITDPVHIPDALAGKAGTTIVA